MGRSNKHRIAFDLLLVPAFVLGNLAPAGAEPPRRIVFQLEARNLEAGIFSMRAGGGDRLRLTTGEHVSPAWSPDGSRVLFVKWSGNKTNLYKMRADGSHRKRLTSTRKKNEYDPAWAPGGHRIVFVRRDDLFTMHADGSNVRRLTKTKRDEASPTWSTSGRIAFNSFRWLDWDLYRADIFTMNQNGTDIERLTNTKAPESSPDWAPRGRWLAYDKVVKGNDQVFKMRADGRRKTRLTKGGARACGKPRESYSPSWSSDGDLIAFVGTYGSSFRLRPASEIWTMKSDGTRERRAVDTRPINCGRRPSVWHYGADLR